MQTNILEYLESTVRKVPYNTAFSDGVTAVTFREVYDQSRAVGSFLCKNGIHGRAVAVLMKRHPYTLTAFLGVVWGGNYYTCLDAEMPGSRINQILETLCPGALIYDDTTKELADRLKFDGLRFHYREAAFGIIDETLLLDVRNRQLDVDPVYVVFTSGSAGMPKGVVGSHRSVIDYTDNLCLALPFHEETVFGSPSPLYFDAYLKEMMSALKMGGTVHLIPRELFMFPVRLVEYLNMNKINTLCWVASALTMISGFRTFETVLPLYVKTVAFAGEVFPVKQLKLWRKALPNARFFNLYGPTETTGVCCYYEMDREFDEDERIPVGKPFRNTQILLLDENGHPCPEGKPGEICIRGTRLTLGYYHSPDRTQACFIQNPGNPFYSDRIYRTGDLGLYNQQGELVFISRKDDQIKRMGHRIEPGEIEAAAVLCSGVNNVCCLPDRNRQKLLLFYTGNVPAGELTAFLKERLPKYMLPNRVQQIEKIPLTPNGKTDRNLLKEIYGRKQDGDSA